MSMRPLVWTGLLIVCLLAASCTSSDTDGRVGTANLDHGSSGQAGEAGFPCPITIPSQPGFVPPDPHPSSPSILGGIWYGDAELWTVLPRDGRWSPRMSVWWSADFGGGAVEERPDVSVTYERLDQEAPLLASDSLGTNAYTSEDGWFMIARIGFEPPGCWKVTARYRDSSLSYVVQVP